MNLGHKKRCYRCKEADAYGTDDLCKPCRKIVAHADYLKHKEKRLAKNREWREANPETFQAARKAWREANPEKVEEYWRRWRRDNPELMREQERERYDPEKAKVKNAKFRQDHAETFRESKRRWNQAHPDKVKAHVATRQARRKGAAMADFTDTDWTFLKELYGWRCAYCNQPVPPLHREHIVPLAKNGDHTLRNILPSCASCNSKKGEDKFIIPHLLRCADGLERPVVAYTTDSKGYTLQLSKKRN